MQSQLLYRSKMPSFAARCKATRYTFMNQLVSILIDTPCRWTEDLPATEMWSKRIIEATKYFGELYW